MMPEQTVRTEEQRRGRPFPWYCWRCRRKEVVPVRRPYREEVLHDGQHHVVEIPDLPVPCCGHCGAEVLTNAEEDAIHRALRSQLKLLQSEEILTGRAALGLGRKEFADRLGVTEELVYRWEDDLEIQSRALDNLMRVFFALPATRSMLAGTRSDSAGVLAPTTSGSPMSP
jgi:DNA-binding transcriptional regulator YiaG